MAILRSQSDRDAQINNQQQKINNIIQRADSAKSSQVNEKQLIISQIKSKIQKAEY